jgi:hypothetical protein
MKRFLIIFGGVVLGALALIYLLVPPINVTFSKEEMQERIAAHIPYEVETGLARILFREADVTLNDDNTVGVIAKFDAAGFTLEGDGVGDVRSSIRYNDGRFYLADISKENIQFNFSKNSNDTIGEVGQTMKNLLKRETDEAEQGTDAARKEKMRGVNTFVEERLQKEAEEKLNVFLGSVPIYDLNRQDVGMKAVALALEDVVISSKGVIARLSVQTFIARVAAIVLSFLCVAIFFGHGILIKLGLHFGYKALVADEEKVRRI